MTYSRKISRRKLLAAGSLAALGAVPEAWSAEKAPGEIRVLFLVGDYFHNPITQEKNWQDVLRFTGWRLMFAQATRFVTPALLAQTDLFVTAHYAKANSLGWSGREIVEKREDEEFFLTDERETAIIDSVRRGMGMLAMHCTVWNGERPKFMDLLGIATPYMHTKVQPTLLHNLNPDHPISRRIAQAKLGEDEIFRADLIPGRTTPLFNLKGDEQPIDTTGGWCHEFGKGRVVVMLPGHTQDPFHAGSFKTLMWRSAHWAIRKDIPERKFENGRPPEKSVYS
jgi:type 1 glutamine amidotransferase